jgi:SpoVK/Ycf46/Vps4 family AAA+-type ATPase
MLYGKPGTGKTSCIKAIAALTQRHIVDVSLKKIKTQKELSEIFYGNKINGIEIDMKKRLYVLEEFDCIIERLKDRKLNKTNIDCEKTIMSNDIDNDLINHNHPNNHQINSNHQNHQNIQIKYNKNLTGINDLNQLFKEDDIGGVNLENLLCLLDGTVELCGSMFIATTNYIELIDKALIRPGRFDCCIEFDNASDEIIIQMIKHFSNKNIKKLKKKINSSKKILSTQSSTQLSAQLSKKLTNKLTNKLTHTHIDEIKKYSVYNGKYIWSPAKISQICLFHIDSPNYYNDVIVDLKKQYDNECKLL